MLPIICADLLILSLLLTILCRLMKYSRCDLLCWSSHFLKRQFVMKKVLPIGGIMVLTMNLHLMKMKRSKAI
jgi:uncharacterized membrane protein YqgA involved in biofilm formation